jgi:hypothetical protein
MSSLMPPVYAPVLQSFALPPEDQDRLCTRGDSTPDVGAAAKAPLDSNIVPLLAPQSGESCGEQSCFMTDSKALSAA